MLNKEEEEYYYLCSENKGADLSLFSQRKKSGFLMMWLKMSYSLGKPVFCINEIKGANQHLCFSHINSTKL